MKAITLILSNNAKHDPVLLNNKQNFQYIPPSLCYVQGHRVRVPYALPTLPKQKYLTPQCCLAHFTSWLNTAKNKPWTTPNVPAAYSQTPDIITGPWIIIRPQTRI